MTAHTTSDLQPDAASPAKPRKSKKRGRAKLLYWIAALPVARRYRRNPPHRDALDDVRAEFARMFWYPQTREQRQALKSARWLWPLLVLAHLSRFTWRNGAIVARRHGRSIADQLRDQLWLYRNHGILPRWYYIFSLYEPGALDGAREFMTRAETKPLLFPYLNERGGARLGDKVAFAERCTAHGIRHVPVLVVARNGALEGRFSDRLPPQDLFIKPIRARGGAGAERWEWTGDGYCRAGSKGGERLSGEALLDRLRSESRKTPRLVQPRAVNHPDLADVSNGALTTARVLSCLDERGEPEVIAAVFRMAIGRNTIVDNFHAGGIAANVDLKTGRLGEASNIGDDVGLGWLSRHPDTGAQIAGRELPMWPQVESLVRQAHRAFDDSVIVGWDVAMLEDGAVLVEGNNGPDLDIVQRMSKRGLGEGRLPELLAFHLRARRQAEG